MDMLVGGCIFFGDVRWRWRRHCQGQAELVQAEELLHQEWFAGGVSGRYHQLP
jgi:hypothetical protein